MDLPVEFMFVHVRVMVDCTHGRNLYTLKTG